MENKTYYKLTTQQNTTYNNCKWIPGEWKETSGDGELCSPGWLHGYHHPLLAVLLNPIHAHINDPKLWKVEIGGEMLDDRGLKFGTTKMRLIEEIQLPVVTLSQRVAFGILCTKTICQDERWIKWADQWLSSEDSTKESATWASNLTCKGAEWHASTAAYQMAMHIHSNTRDDIAYFAAWAVSFASGKSLMPLPLIDIAQKAMEF